MSNTRASRIGAFLFDLLVAGPIRFVLATLVFMAIVGGNKVLFDLELGYPTDILVAVVLNLAGLAMIASIFVLWARWRSRSQAVDEP